MRFLLLQENRYEIFFILTLLLVGLFFSTHRLTESPPIWFDEANYIQVAINFMTSGKSEIQVAPGELSPATYSSVGYPLIYPLSLSFKYFGVGLLQARAVMVVFIMALIFISYLLVKKLFGFKIAVFSSLLLVSFPPLYGHGKNVMGEVPGVFFLVLFLFSICKIEKTNSSWLKPDYKDLIYYVLAGLAAGLCVSTKPIFLILLPALVISILLKRKGVHFYWGAILAFILSFIIPLAIWFKFQSQVSNSFIEMFIFYTNPHGLTSYYETIIGNIQRFFTESTPIYFLGALLVWIASIIIRTRMKREISFTEVTSVCFSILLFLAYLGTIGFYRYFFPAQIVAILYFPFALYILLKFFNSRYNLFKVNKFKSIFWLMVVMLIAVNFYHLLFNSWVASHYQSKRASVLNNYFQNYTSDKNLFLYNAPEVIVFLPYNNYYQYLEFTPTLLIGEEQLGKIESGEVDEIITLNKTYSKDSDLFSAYKIKDEIAGYVVLEKESYD